MNLVANTIPEVVIPYVQQNQTAIIPKDYGREEFEKIQERIEPCYTYTEAFNVNPIIQIKPVVSTSCIIEEKEGTIMGVEEDTVRLKFGDNLTVNFHVCLLLRDIPNLHYGQKVIYQIKKGKDGFKSHQFVVSDSNNVDNSLGTIEDVIKKFAK